MTTRNEDLALIHEAIEKLDAKLELTIELLCPKCGPAAIVRMHPETGPQPVIPREVVPANGHKHD
jgi:hypothetical protein